MERGDAARINRRSGKGQVGRREVIIRSGASNATSRQGEVWVWVGKEVGESYPRGERNGFNRGDI